LTNANLTNADLDNSYLVGADLGGANLTGADLGGADLTVALGVPSSTSGVTWDSATCPDGTFAGNSNITGNGGTCVGHGPGW
jgi:uncharacterized protein YjbI with pentapeptide repeats